MPALRLSDWKNGCFRKLTIWIQMVVSGKSEGQDKQPRLTGFPAANYRMMADPECIGPCVVSISYCALPSFYSCVNGLLILC